MLDPVVKRSEAPPQTSHPERSGGGKVGEAQSKDPVILGRGLASVGT
jgi:hypothetical protein